MNGIQDWMKEWIQDWIRSGGQRATEKTSKFAKFGQNNEVNLRSCPQIGPLTIDWN